MNYSYLNERGKLTLSVNLDQARDTATEPLHLVLFLTKDSPQLFDMDSRSKQTENNDLNSAIRRFRTVARLWQAFNSEQLHANNLGYSSFRLEEDAHGEVVVNVVQSNKHHLADLHAAKEFDIYNIVFDSIEKSTLMMSKKTINKLHVAALICDAHYDPIKRTLLGHASLGGGTDKIRLAIFGSHLTHSWPESEQEFIWRLTDRSPIDRSAVADDNSPTKLKSFNVGAGTFLHEIGHVLGLQHTSGIMQRGYDNLNAAFISIEPIGDSSDFIHTNRTGALDGFYIPVWNKKDALKLSRHVCFYVENSQNENSSHLKAVYLK